MKKLINNTTQVVKEQMEGMALAHPEIEIHLDPKFILRANRDRQKVAIISGGGSGHEPMHGGFVGVGMLDGACPGEVFTSPTPDQILACAKAAHSGEGMLLLVKNYTGDVMNFNLATEMLHEEKIEVQSILIDDDVAVKDSLHTAGRRGVGTTVIMEKIVGAAAEAGYNLRQCADLARKVNTSGRSMGMALSSCIVPAAGKPNFDIADHEMEFGVGIHGEPGRERIPYVSADEVTTLLTNGILEDGEYTRTVEEWDGEKGEWSEKVLTNKSFEKGDQVIVLVNGLGGTPVAELYTIYRKLHELCTTSGITIARNLIGNYMTSLEMKGCSITLVKADEELLKFWDAPVNTPSLKWA